MITGSLIAMIEPLVNSIAFYFHEKAWKTIALLKRREHLTAIKTISFALIHFSIAFGISYLLTGSLLIGGMIAVLEPIINTLIYYFHEKYWRKHHNDATLSLHHCH